MQGKRAGNSSLQEAIAMLMASRNDQGNAFHMEDIPMHQHLGYTLQANYIELHYQGRDGSGIEKMSRFQVPLTLSELNAIQLFLGFQAGY